ncbi:MAG: DUF2079 domain-containing protein [Ktedonobacteraceae bacterium]|nr:DUF2079 domain-containing protein [Ktedonobacteraceae bacterium]
MMSWRKRLSVWQNRLYLYPAPEPLPRTHLFWLAMGMVTLAVILFSVYFISYLTARHDAFLTNAEDLGIMDQVVWNTVHGNVLHMTICNIVSDTNCYSPDGIMRFAIHIEPILFPLSSLYLLWPSPKTLLVVQTLVVAIGAYPAFWLARLRLRNELASVAIALLYLLYPAQQQATVFDFHAVTFTASLLFFALYFMYTRRTVLLFVFAILAMACKEEVALIVVMFGLWSMVFQRRWRVGAALMVLGVVWLGVEYLYLIPHFSPTGRPLLVGRYEYLGKGPVQMLGYILRHPVQILREHVLESSHLFYLRILVSPAGYLPLLAPWILVLAAPVVALNLLSSQSGQFSGMFQYNAEIVPVLIFAAIEAVVLLLWLAQTFMTRLRKISITRAETRDVTQAGDAQTVRPAGTLFTMFGSRQPQRLVYATLLTLLLAFMIAYSCRVNYGFHGHMPFSIGFVWPAATPHTLLAQRFISMIPPDVSVSAQTSMVPHLSQREKIYMFPYEDHHAEYILLDVTGDIYPYNDLDDYTEEVKSVLLSEQYGVVAAQEGYLLLKQGLPPPAVVPVSMQIPPDSESGKLLLMPDLPDEFCSHIYVSPSAISHPLQATFTGAGGSINLLGFSTNAPAAPATFSRSSGYMSVTTYWQITDPVDIPLQILLLFVGSDGKEYFATNDMPSLNWCPMNTWRPGAIVQMKSQVFSMQSSDLPYGLAHISLALLPLTQTSSTIMDIQARLPVHPVNGPGTVPSGRQANALQLMPMNIVR